MSDTSMLHPIVDDIPEKITGKSADGQVRLPLPEPFPAMQPREAYRRPGVNWRLIIWGIFAILGAIVLVAYSQGIFSASSDRPIVENKPRSVIPASPTPSPTPAATPTATAMEGENAFVFLDPTATLTPEPGGRLL